jgi:uncharacterized membrane protein
MSQTRATKSTDAARAPKSVEANEPATSTEKAAPPRASDTLALKLSSPEFTTTLSHFHRAEIARMAGWRDRLDRTSNWAITVVAAMLSVSLSTPSAHHGVLLFAMLLITLLLWIEARRYRFFDVYRARVRQLERHYFARILAPEADPDGWAAVIAASLRKPSFLISQRVAVSRRLSRNYGWMFLILLLAWLLKLSSPRIHSEGAAAETVLSLPALLGNAAIGPVPGWVVFLCVALFYAGLLTAIVIGGTDKGELSIGEVHM